MMKEASISSKKLKAPGRFDEGGNVKSLRALLIDSAVLLLYLMAGFLLVSALLSAGEIDPIRLLGFAVVAIACVYMARSIREEQKLAAS